MSIVIILGAPGSLISTGAVTGWIDFVIARYGWQVAKPWPVRRQE
jgi:hypothetical protein